MNNSEWFSVWLSQRQGGLVANALGIGLLIAGAAILSAKEPPVVIATSLCVLGFLLFLYTGYFLVRDFLEAKRLAAAYLNLGAISVSDTDALMQRAMAQGRATRSLFFELLPANSDRAMVRFSFMSNTGTLEHLWAEVRGIEGERLTVFVVTPPATHYGEFQPERSLNANEIDDWQITLPNDSIRGGFTSHVLFAIYRRDQGELPPEIAAHEARFVDAVRAAAQ